MNLRDKRDIQGSEQKKPRKSGFNVGEVSNLALDTVDVFKHAITSIGQEMMHQISPRLVSKPGHFQTKERGSKETGLSKKDKDEDFKNKKEKRVDESKESRYKSGVREYRALPISNVHARKSVRDEKENLDVDQIINLTHERKLSVPQSKKSFGESSVRPGNKSEKIIQDVFENSSRISIRGKIQKYLFKAFEKIIKWTLKLSIYIYNSIPKRIRRVIFKKGAIDYSEVKSRIKLQDDEVGKKFPQREDKNEFIDSDLIEDQEVVIQEEEIIEEQYSAESDDNEFRIEGVIYDSTSSSIEVDVGDK